MDTPSLYHRFNRWLERVSPTGLYRRALLILIVPVLLLQLLLTGFILDRHWDSVTKILGRSLAREIGLLVELYEKSDKSDAAIASIEDISLRRLRLELEVIKGGTIPPLEPAPYWRLFEHKMQQYLTRETGRPFSIDPRTDDDQVEMQVEVEPGLIFKVSTPADRAWAASTPFLLVLMLGSALVLLSIAALFLRNQIKPILELAMAAKDFGLGRDTASFRPRGAAEIRQAGLSFMDMRRRIARHVEQRTAMLAGVSHDLRTILTRFKLELAVIGDNPKVHPLKEDVDEMQHMLEDYMAFVKGDGGEAVVPVSIAEAVAATIESVERDRPDSDAVIEMGVVPLETVKLKPNAFRRLLSNLVGNAARYGSKVKVTAEIRDERLWVNVDDDGPGIRESDRDHAFKPFVRLDNARNLDETGTGLGLAIALDIAHAHGGDIFLEDSPMGGLRAVVKLPV
jgi:two-component system, OmpR family, osmolarity sensor histidine kinase EnvZ